VLAAGGNFFRISYQGGDGNDVTLTAITRFIVTGPDAGAVPRVRVWNAADQSLRFEFLAYRRRFKGGVRVATADFNNDGFPDIVTAPGPGTTAVVNVFSGNTPAGQQPALLLAPIHPYGNFQGGAFVATGDVNLDGVPDVIVAPGAGTRPTIRIFNGKDGTPLGGINVFARTFRGGVTVAAGDVNGDGRLDIVAGSGPGGPPRVRGFDAATGAQLPGAIGDFLAFPASFRGGVYVAAGDVAGEGEAEVIVGPGPGARPIIKVFNPATMAAPASIRTFTAREKRGVRVAAVNAFNTGKDAILAVLGPQGNAEVRLFDAVQIALIDRFFAEAASFRRGLFVAGSP
jgi:hypothetical protein